MSNFYDNIFYYYRGSQNPQNGGYDQQLENNTTKALANTLMHCSPTVAIKFLGWLGIETTAKEVGLELQSATIGRDRIHTASNRLLVGLVAGTKSKSNSICDDLEGPTNGGSIPDAWLYGEDFVVLIESKVENAPLELNQMRSHFQKLKVDAGQPSCRVQTWAEVHQFFRGLLDRLNGKDKWLVEQFTQYLTL